jgi:hypothetical protein
MYITTSMLAYFLPYIDQYSCLAAGVTASRERAIPHGAELQVDHVMLHDLAREALATEDHIAL